MVRLLHFSLDPFSRRIRLSLAEMGLAAELNEERPWEMREAFLDMNPAGTLPVMIHDDGTVCAGVEAVGGYLDEQWPLDTGSLWGTDPVVRAEVRRLVAWFDGKFHHEVTSPLAHGKGRAPFCICISRWWRAENEPCAVCPRGITYPPGLYQCFWPRCAICWSAMS